MIKSMDEELVELKDHKHFLDVLSIHAGLKKYAHTSSNYLSRTKENFIRNHGIKEKTK